MTQRLVVRLPTLAFLFATFGVNVACAPEGAEGLLAADLDGQSWRGDFASTNTCSDGQVSLALTQVDDDWFEGEYSFTSILSEANFATGIYKVEGALFEGNLQLDQVALLDPGFLPWGFSWCSGEFDLALGQDGEIEGAWVPRDCACDGTVRFGDAG